MSKNISTGKYGEDKALEYLLNQGYFLIERNWHRREGEIDLIVFDNRLNELVFVEVKVRNSEKFGSIEESITEKKKLKLHDIIDRYVMENNHKDKYRLDFIGLVNGNRIIHYKNVEI